MVDNLYYILETLINEEEVGKVIIGFGGFISGTNRKITPVSQYITL